MKQFIMTLLAFLKLYNAGLRITSTHSSITDLRIYYIRWYTKSDKRSKHLWDIIVDKGVYFLDELQGFEKTNLSAPIVKGWRRSSWELKNKYIKGKEND